MREHLPLVLTDLPALLVVLRILSAAGCDPETAYGILQAALLNCLSYSHPRVRPAGGHPPGTAGQQRWFHIVKAELFRHREPRSPWRMRPGANCPYQEAHPPYALHDILAPACGHFLNPYVKR